MQTTTDNTWTASGAGELVAVQVPSRAGLSAPVSWRLTLPTAFALSVLFGSLYSASNWLTAHRAHIATWCLSWERHMPLVPWMILPYMALDPLFFLSFFLCATRGELWVHAKRIASANLIAFACFMVFPLRMDAPHATAAQTGIFTPLFRWLYHVDLPYNLAPSLHVAQAMIIWVIIARHTRGIIRAALSALLLLSCLSTVFTWQHRVPDVITGAMLAVFCCFCFPDRKAGSAAVAPALSNA